MFDDRMAYNFRMADEILQNLAALKARFHDITVTS